MALAPLLVALAQALAPRDYFIIFGAKIEISGTK
jgi:hypothetical protein